MANTKADIQNIDTDNEEFQNVWKLIRFTAQSVFMTGKAGAGKSTFLRYITQNTRKRHIVLAPTGIAAVNVGGVTLHSFFKLPFKPLLPDDPDFMGDRLRKRLAYSKAKIKLIRELELIIIDEVSMVRADIIDFIDRILRTYSGNHRMPFGGKQLLLVGDIFQLEPVVTNDMRDLLRRYWPNPYFFSANVFRDFHIVPIELKKIYRQRDPAFLSILENIRTGNATPSDIAILNARKSESMTSDPEKFSMTLATRRDTVEQINRSHLAALTSPEVTYTGKVVDEFPDNSLPVPIQLSIKAGAQVVFVKNDREHRWVNGTIGKVTLTKPKEIEVELESGQLVTVVPEIWENINYKYDEKEKKVIEEVVGTYTQMPINLAWALTIHKSQGLTFNNVIIDACGAFTGGQTYVALSRCTSLEGITLKTQLHQRDVFVSPSIIDFSQSFNDPALIDSALEQARADAAYADAAKAFDNRNFSLAISSFAEGVKARNELSRPSAQRLIAHKLSKISQLEKEVASKQKLIDSYQAKLDALAREYTLMGRDCMLDALDPTAALANFNKALSLSPGNPEALLAKADLLLRFNDSTSALETLAQCTAGFVKLPADDVADVALGLHRQGHTFEAIDLLLSISGKKGKPTPRSYRALADIYESIGDHSAAREYRAKAAILTRPRKK